VLLAALFMAPWHAPAATVQAVGQSHGCLIDIDGEIDRRTPRMLDGALKAAAGTECVVRVNSNGGDLDAAIDTGKLIRRHGARTRVSEQARCASACVMLFIGGVSRDASGAIGMHRFYSTRPPRSEREAQTYYRDINGRIRQHLDDMNIPERLMHVMNSTPPGQVHWLTGERDRAMLRELHVAGEDPVWADQRDAATAARMGISIQEYYGRQQRSHALCDLERATAANARERARCRFEVLEGKR